MGDPINPYAAPRAFDEPEALVYSDSFRDASNGTRLVNAFSDTVVAGVLAFLLVLMLGRLLGEAAIFLTLMFRPVYYVFFESVFQATPGKMFSRTRVITESGGKPSVGQIVMRTLIRFVPFEPFSFFGSSRGWHDRWSKTRVVMR